MLATNRKGKNRQKKVFRILIVVVFLISLTGASGYFIFSQQTKKPMLISPLAKTVLGETTEDQGEMIYLKEQLSKQKIALKTVVASGSSYRLVLKDGSEVLFSSQKSLSSQISSLQFITSRLTMEGRRFHRLDLRFEKPVVVF